MQLLANLSLREKAILVFALIAIVSLSFHALVWEPLYEQNAELNELLEQEQDDLRWIRENMGRLKVTTQKTKTIKGSFVSWIDLQIKKHALNTSLKRIKPRGGNEVKVWLEEVNVKKLLSFIGQVTQYPVDIEAIKMTAIDHPGLADVTLTLVSKP